MRRNQQKALRGENCGRVRIDVEQMLPLLGLLLVHLPKKLTFVQNNRVMLAVPCVAFLLLPLHAPSLLQKHHIHSFMVF